MSEPITDKPNGKSINRIISLVVGIILTAILLLFITFPIAHRTTYRGKSSYSIQSFDYHEGWLYRHLFPAQYHSRHVATLIFTSWYQSEMEPLTVWFFNVDNRLEIFHRETNRIEIRNWRFSSPVTLTIDKQECSFDYSSDRNNLILDVDDSRLYFDRYLGTPPSGLPPIRSLTEEELTEMRAQERILCGDWDTRSNQGSAPLYRFQFRRDGSFIWYTLMPKQTITGKWRIIDPQVIALDGAECRFTIIDTLQPTALLIDWNLHGDMYYSKVDSTGY